MALADEYPKAELPGLPEFYDIQYGGTHERYTTSSVTLTFLGYEFLTSPIKRTGFTFDTDFSNVSVTIYAPVTSGWERFISNAPLEPTSVTIYRALRDDLTDYAIIFDGDVMTVGFRDRVAQARCDSSSNILNYETPRLVYQSYCNHELFDSGCGLDYTEYLVDATVTVSGGGKVLSSATFDTYADDYFRIGRCIFEGDERLITDHTGTDISIVIPFSASLITGSEVTVLPGCDGSPTTCKSFNNFQAHYLGMPYIPSKNPVVWGI